MLSTLRRGVKRLGAEASPVGVFRVAGLQHQGDHFAHACLIQTQSARTLWWAPRQCPDGHVHSLKSDRSRGNECPKCNDHQAVKQTLQATKAPLVAVPWDFESDKGTPDDHLRSWLAQKTYRTRGSGCPLCSGRQVCKHTCPVSATKAPLVAVPWDYESYKGTPDDHLRSGSAQKSYRTRGSGCPLCSGRQVCKHT
ncbi:hypothetical protein ABBQ38_004693 [Trebouxia sp. C0009 RCD-2024]